MTQTWNICMDTLSGQSCYRRWDHQEEWRGICCEAQQTSHRARSQHPKSAQVFSLHLFRVLENICSPLCLAHLRYQDLRHFSSIQSEIKFTWNEILLILPVSFDYCSEFARMNSFFPSVLTVIIHLIERVSYLSWPTCSELYPQDDQECPPPPPPPPPLPARVWCRPEKISSSRDSRGCWCSHWSGSGRICSV